MQTQPNPRTFAAPMPSLMSVFDEKASRRSLEEVANTDHDLTGPKEPFSANTETCFSPISQPYSVFHQPRDSTSTSASESSDSSPTTTVSTLDSASMTESSPGTSPETPASSSISPLSAMDTSRFKPPERSQTDPTTGAFFELQRPVTPAKKPRNLKNLAVNTATAPYSLGRAVASASLAVDAPPMGKLSAPASPAFVKPPTPPRRKIANLGLTIMTPANSNIPHLAIPPTPSHTRPNTLRHFQSSPSLTLCTPGSGPPGGMTLSGARPRPPPRGFADIPLDEEEEDQEPNFDIPQSQEEKPDGYPNGPIRIYESGIDLYSEPTVEVASQYDVILNVASEVKNPFLHGANQPSVAGVDSSAPSTTVGIIENPQDSSSPDTPKATPITTEAPSIPVPRPEYIHVPWEHNTDIVPDLHRLVKLIDDRVTQGKRVLVHCQLGVSRSASLIVAYGLYKNPGMTVQEAYDAVKRRSRWIGPNMNLIMQLQEFRSGLARSARREHGFPSQMFSVPRNLNTTVSSASTNENFELGSVSTPVTPRTAPLPPEATSPMRSSTGSIGPFSAGPVEPGQGSFWEPGFRRSWGHSPSNKDLNALSSVPLVQDTPYVDTKGHVVPVVTVVSQPPAASSTSNEAKVEATKSEENVQREKSLKRKTPNFSRQLPLRRDWTTQESTNDPSTIEPLVSPRSEDFHMVGLTRQSDTDSGDAYGILSPIRTEFPSNPFERLVLTQTTPERQPFTSFGSITRSVETTKPASRNDSMEPSATLATPPRNPPLRTKFSSPSLSQQRRLRQLQTDMEAALPHVPGSHKGYMDDLDALMSPRATEFTVNPFHELLSPGASHSPQSEPPVTPTKSEADPRSPAQHGISPITRNIFDVL